MRPVVEALDVLQGEENVGMGFLLPTLTILYEKFESLKKDNSVKHCQPLVYGLIHFTTMR